MSRLEADHIKGILLDLDGVFYVGDQPVDGARDTLRWLNGQGIAYRFITNTSTRTPQEIAGRLAGMGFEVGPGQIFSAISATRDYLARQGRPSVHLLVHDAVKQEFQQFPQDPATPDYVVIGDIGPGWDYPLLNRVFNQVMNGTKLVAVHMNKYWQTAQGLQMDIGAFVAGLEFVTGTQARVVGKPSEEFFLLATASLGVPQDQVVVVGDDIENDVGGAQAAGLGGILVRTGKYREELVRRAEIVPNAIIDSIADLPALLGA